MLSTLSPLARHPRPPIGVAGCRVDLSRQSLTYGDGGSQPLSDGLVKAAQPSSKSNITYKVNLTGSGSRFRMASHFLKVFQKESKENGKDKADNKRHGHIQFYFRPNREN